MKRLFSIIAAILLLSSTAWGGATLDPAQSTSVASQSKGVIAHWPLNTESLMSATVVADDIADNHATLSTVTVGAEYSEFDGADSEVDIGAKVVDDGNITWSAWIYPQGEGENANEYIYDNGKFIVIWVDDADKISVYSDGSTPANSANSAVPISSWYHIAITRPTAGTNTNIYINGVLSGTANQNSGTPATGSGNGIIGNYYTSTIRTFDGYIAHVKVRNYLATTAEITAEYNAGRLGSKTTINPAL